MKKKQFIRIGLTVMILLFVLCGLSLYRTKQMIPRAFFDQEYAEVNVPLTVSCDGFLQGTSFTYIWTIGDTVIDNTTNTYTPVYEDLEKFITVSVIPDDGSKALQIQMYFSTLPVIYIDTDDGGPIYSKDYYFDASLKMQGNALYNTANSDMYHGAIGIRGRGNSTWRGSKLPYRIKLETAANLFQMGSNKNWVLLSNEYDDSLMRNKIAYDLSGEIGMTYMRSTWVDLILNGQYAGNYQICEQIRIDENRVDILDLEKYSKTAAKILVDNNVIAPQEKEALEDHLTWHMDWLSSGIIEYEDHIFDISSYIDLPDINGGFLFELDAFYDEPSKFIVENQPIQIRGPKYAGSNDKIMAYAVEFVSAFYHAAYFSDDFYTIFQEVPTHYTELFDIRSLAQYFIITEVFFNEDTGLKSTYFYKDLDSPAQMGPVWDMDYSSGGQGISAEVYDQWQTVFYSNYSQDNQWYKGLIRDPYFLSKAMEVWEANRETIFHIVEENGPIEQAYDYIYESALANAKIWPPEINPDPSAISTHGFIQGYQTFKTWMTNRLNWLDSQFTTLKALTDSIGAFDAGTGVSLICLDQTATVTAETGVLAKFYFNGILQTELPLENGTASWSFSLEQQTSESDVIQVRIYQEDGTQIGSDFVDFR